MVFTGMIFRFDSEQGTGQIMLSDGDIKGFSIDEWVDTSNVPKVGLAVSYENSNNIIKIKVPSEPEKTKDLPDDKINNEDITSFTSLEEYQTYFSDQGFDIIKNKQEPVYDELTMGKFCDESVQKVSIRLENAKAELSEETILLSSLDDYISYFEDIGYKLVKKPVNNESQHATLRRYSMDQHQEITLKYNDSKVTATKTINGQKSSL